MKLIQVSSSVLVAIALIGAFSQGANTAVWAEFNPPVVRPGQPTTVRLVPANLSLDPYQFLLLAPAADEPTGRETFASLEAVVRATVRGETTILIPPDLAPGRYRAYIECVPCAPTSSGRSILPVGELRVLTLVDTSTTGSPGLGPPDAAVGLLSLIFTVAFVWSWRSRRRGLRSHGA